MLKTNINAYHSGSVDVVQTLAEVGANVNALDKNKETPIFRAIIARYGIDFSLN